VDPVEAALAELEFGSAWRESGLLDPHLVRCLHERFLSSSDKNTEHYRHAAFQAVFAGRQALGDGEVDAYLALVEADADAAMASSALLLLVEWSGLTSAQQDRIERHPLVQGSPIAQRFLRRARLRRVVALPHRSADDTARCLAAEDGRIQDALLDDGRLTRAELTDLHSRAANKRIRHDAEEQHRRRFGGSIA